MEVVALCYDELVDVFKFHFVHDPFAVDDGFDLRRRREKKGKERGGGRECFI